MAMRHYNAMGEEIHPSDEQEATYLRLRRRYGFFIGLYGATGLMVLFVGVVLIIGDVWNPDWLPLLLVTALVLWAVGLLTHFWFAYVNSPITYEAVDEADRRFAHRHGLPSAADMRDDWPVGQTQTWTSTCAWRVRRTEVGYELYRFGGWPQEWRWEGTLPTAAAAFAAVSGIEDPGQSGPLPPAQAG